MATKRSPQQLLQIADTKTGVLRLLDTEGPLNVQVIRDRLKLQGQEGVRLLETALKVARDVDHRAEQVEGKRGVWRSVRPGQQPLPVGQPQARPATRELIYIAAPFNATKDSTVEANIRAAEYLALQLVRYYPAVQPVVPHSIGRVLFGVQAEDAAYKGTLALMRRCDAVLFSCQYQGSKGCEAERADAEARNQPIFDEQDLFNVADRFGHWLRTGERL